MTTEQIKIRLTTDEARQLRQLADDCGVQMTALSSIFVRAGVNAVKENGGELSLPLQLRVATKSERKK
jgi:hypothetical protein